MTSSLYVLTTSSLDSSPSLLLTLPPSPGLATAGGGRLLLECGEGTQRACLEYTQRLSTLRGICLTSLDHSSVGGLPGLLLTAADVLVEMGAATSASAAATSHANSKNNNNHTNGNINTNSNNNNGSTTTTTRTPATTTTTTTSSTNSLSQSPWPFYVFPPPDTTTTTAGHLSSAVAAATLVGPPLHIVGPPGTKAWLASLHYFVRRTDFAVHVQEQTFTTTSTTTTTSRIPKPVEFHPHHHPHHPPPVMNATTNAHETTPPPPNDQDKSPPKKRAKQEQQQQPNQPNNSSSSSRTSNDMSYAIYPMVFSDDNKDGRMLISYFFATPPLPGKFRLEKAVALGVPRGPLYSQLQKGHSVTFTVGGGGHTSFKKKQKKTNNKNDQAANKSKNKTNNNNNPQQQQQPKEQNKQENHHKDTDHGTSSNNDVDPSPATAAAAASSSSSTTTITTPTTKTVHSWQVMDPPLPGVGLLVLRYPSIPTKEPPHHKDNNNENDDSSSSSSSVLSRFWQQVDQQIVEPHGLVMSKPKDGTNRDNADPPRTKLDLVVHLASQEAFDHPDSVTWRQKLKLTANHVPECDNNDNDGDNDNDNDDTTKLVQHILVHTNHQTNPYAASPHQTATQTARIRSLLCSDIYQNPMVPQRDAAYWANGGGTKDTAAAAEEENVAIAYSSMEYQLIPRAKQGFVSNPYHDNSQKRQEELETLARNSGALDLARQICLSSSSSAAAAPTTTTRHQSPEGTTTTNNNMNPAGGQLIFMGTASAMPCKYRNVSGIALLNERTSITTDDQKNKNNSTQKSIMLLDAGEGTIGQLLQTMNATTTGKKDENDDDDDDKNVLSMVKAVWISHFHADHHLGLLRLLHERKAKDGSKVLIIAPRPVLDFLRDYGAIYPFIDRTYTGLDCRDFLEYNNPPTSNYSSISGSSSQRSWRSQQLLFQATGITRCRSVPVQHCRFAYAVVLDGTNFGRLVYSGDCRPSRDLAQAGHGADVLIHEATFEDSMQAEAILKRHCTIGEALQVAEQMQAKNVILTHFSQRYPRIPPLSTETNKETSSSSSSSSAAATTTTATGAPIVFAFDFMTLKPNDFDLASKLTPAVRLLYPEEKNDENNDADATAASSEMARNALSQPGLFAHSELL